MRQNILFCEKRWYHEVISRPFIRTGFFYFTENSIGEIRWDTLLNKNKKNKKNKEKYLFSVRYLMAKFKLSKELLIQNKMAFIYSLIDAFIITIVFMIIELINLPFYIQILIGFALLFGLIYAIYELLGRNLERKENNERV